MAKTLTGLSLSQEQAYQERETEKLARRMERSFTREILKAMREFAEYDGNPGKQSQAMAEHKDRLAKLLERDYSRAFDLFGARVLRAGEKAHPGRWETKNAQDEFDRMRQAWIAQMVAQKVTPIAGTTEKQAKRIINDIVAQATIDGLSQAATGDRIRKAINEQGGLLARGRSRVIARTETHSSANAAGQEAAQATGLDMQKEWVSARGPRTREDHSEADGQTVDLAASFFVGGEELRYPGDPNGSAGNIINCRCASVHVVLD